LHGEGLSKLANRADTGAQRAVYVRVNLLQGALAFLRGEAPDALSLFRKAERLLQELTITEDDDDHIASLVALGVSSHVARASLLACQKNVERAAAHALERIGVEQRRREKRHREQETRQYGRTAHGDPIDPDAMQTLASLGYSPPALVAEALRRANNDVEAAIGSLCDAETQEAMQLAVLKVSSSTDGVTDHVPADPSKVAMLCEMGFAEKTARSALERAGNDVAQAALALGQDGGDAEAPEAMEKRSAADAAAKSCTETSPATATGGPESAPAAVPKTPKMTQEDHAIVAREGLREAVASSERAYEEGLHLQTEAIALRFLLSQLE